LISDIQDIDKDDHLNRLMNYIMTIVDESSLIDLMLHSHIDLVKLIVHRREDQLRKYHKFIIRKKKALVSVN
jgi:hypothetical protein